MMPLTHNLTAVALAASMAALLPQMEAGEFAIGCILGARAPDWLEIAEYNHMTGRRGSLIPHRTLTHWPWAWMMLLGLIIPSIQQGGQGAIGLAGFAVGGLLHIGMDYLTPMGVPLGLHPFGERSSLNWIRTGSIGELVVNLTAFVLVGVIWSVAHAV
ncbi:MAG: metal-dependent hydrolase [Candidatus Thiodiazotropha lotti]|nr:metal-dependent hydrolase [Candidatus Thiodiazotropha lotti]